jgi:FkbM family methyltransferase
MIKINNFSLFIFLSIIIIFLVFIAFVMLYKILYCNYKENFTQPISRFNNIQHPFYGEITVFDNNDLISNIVLNNKIWEDNIIDIMSKYYVTDTDILDIGANMGLNTLGLHKKKQITGTCHAFEPQPDVFTLMSFNLKSVPCKTYCMSLSDKTEIVSMNVNINNIGASSISNSKDNERNMNLLAIPLDLIKFNNKISLIKMDVEGYEDKVLKGSKITFETHKPVLIIEIWNDKFQNVNAILEEMNYKLDYHIGGDDYVYIPKI